MQKRKLFINRRYQIPHAAITLCSHLLVSMVTTIMVSAFYLLFFHGGITFNHNRLLPWYLLGMGSIILSSTLVYSLRRSRRIAGLMLKIEGTLARAARGQFPDHPLIFRKDDFFKELAPTLNACLLTIKEKEQRLENLRDQLDNLLALVEKEGDAPTACARLQMIINELHDGNRQ